MLPEETQLFIALFTDADVGRDLAKQLRKRGYDAVSALEIGRYRPSDEEQWDYAISEQRTILTFNTKDFEPLFKKYWDTGKEHYGVIVSNQLSIGELVRRTINLLNAVTADEMKNNIKYLGEYAEK